MTSKVSSWERSRPHHVALSCVRLIKTRRVDSRHLLAVTLGRRRRNRQQDKKRASSDEEGSTNDMVHIMSRVVEQDSRHHAQRGQTTGQPLLLPSIDYSSAQVPLHLASAFTVPCPLPK